MRSSSIALPFVLLALVGLSAALALPHHSNGNCCWRMRSRMSRRPWAPPRRSPRRCRPSRRFSTRSGTSIDTDQSTVAPIEVPTASTDIPEIDGEPGCSRHRSGKEDRCSRASLRTSPPATNIWSLLSVGAPWIRRPPCRRTMRRPPFLPRF
ncbi:hypothetical protein M3Y99_01539800 [Aphelenchoides fujianensis]|nr:hypothetical protein M3Y99_01539800 [Aphelenchoides fujianensis]